MLRGNPRFTVTAPGGASALPPADFAFGSEPIRPPGIRFYRAKESFFLPYSLLLAMHWRAERVTLTFTHDEVMIEGQGLHSLDAEVAEFKVARIREQEDSEDADNESVHVAKIIRRPRE
jgi:hypothetical protein